MFKTVLSEILIRGLLKSKLSSNTAVKTFKTRQFVKFSVEYFKNNEDYSKIITLHKAQWFNGYKIQQLLPNCSEVKTNDSFLKYNKNLDQILQNVDIKFQSTFSFLFALHTAQGIGVFNTKFYRSVLKMWEQEVYICTAPQLIVMLYFLGQTKNFPFPLIVGIQKRLEELFCEFTFCDWSIICHNLFLMKIALPPTVMEHIVTVTVGSLFSANRFQIIAIVKEMRYSRHPMQKLLPQLSKFILETYHDYGFVECTHFLATYTNAGSYDETVFRTLEEHIFEKPLQELLPKTSENMQHLHPNVRVRSKDIARLLWAMSHARHILAPCNLEILLTVLRRKICEGDFISNPHHLVDCLQSLIFYNFYPDDLLSHVLNEKFVWSCIKIKKAKPCHQLFFISNSVEIEHSTYRGCKINKRVLQKLGNYLKRSVSKELSSRDGLRKIFTLFVECYSEVKENKVKCMSLLPHIPIAGIVLKACHQTRKMQYFDIEHFDSIDILNLKDYISIEVLDNSVSLAGSLNGLLASKVRQMEKLGCKVVVLTEEDVTRLSIMDKTKSLEEINHLLFDV